MQYACTSSERFQFLAAETAEVIWYLNDQVRTRNHEEWTGPRPLEARRENRSQFNLHLAY